MQPDASFGSRIFFKHGERTQYTVALLLASARAHSLDASAGSVGLAQPGTAAKRAAAATKVGRILAKCYKRSVRVQKGKAQLIQNNE